MTSGLADHIMRVGIAEHRRSYTKAAEDFMLGAFFTRSMEKTNK
jgi:hypothetical protein